MRKLSLLLRLLYLPFVACLLLLSIGFAILQTKWAKEKIAERLIQAFASSGITAHIENLDGRLPFTWHIDRLQLQLQSGESLDLQEVKVRIAILPLLHKSVSISYFNVESALVTLSKAPSGDIKTQVKKLQDTLYSSYHIQVRRLKIDNCIIENTSHFSIIAQGSLNKRLSAFQGDVTLSTGDASLYFLIEGSRAANFARIELKTQLSLLPIPIQEEGNLAVSLKGKWTSWQAYLNDQPLPSPLLGELHAKFFPAFSHSLFYRCWEIDSHFSLLDHAYFLDHLDLKSDLIDLSATGQIDEDIFHSHLQAAYTLPDLSLMPIPHLTGAIMGQFSYENGSIISNLSSEHIQYYSVPLDQLCGRLEARYENGDLQGIAKFTAQGDPLTLASSVDFQWQDQKEIALHNLLVEGPGLLISSDLTWDLKKAQLLGNLHAQLDHLHPYAFLFHESVLDGGFGLSLQFLTEEEKQSIQASLLGKDLVFREYEADQCTLTVAINDPFQHPIGTGTLALENLHSPLCKISSMALETSSNEEQEWPFIFRAEGTVSDPFFCFAQGRWIKDAPLFSLEMTDFSGEILSQPFYLDFPFSLEKTPHFTRLTPIQMSIGEGHVFATCDLHPMRSTMQCDLQHFPLEIIGLLDSSRHLTGAFSLNGFLDATPQNIQGSLNLALEEMSFLNSEKEAPLKIKGSLQAHIDQSILQAHAKLNATPDQFMDFSATLPLSYTTYPLDISFDRQRPLSSELIAEGRIQDIFDFINLGINRLTGYLSAHLFLSQTLNSPSLQGDIEWQAGTYENYLTGTSIRDINAKFQASHDQIHLLELTAKDDKKGTLTGEGTIDLDPKAHFPYRFIGELNNLNTLHFNLLDCNLSGPVYFTGTTEGILAQGNLLVPQAEFKIPDKLAAEIPVLPVTYVNRPYHLFSKVIAPVPVFPFQINLEITAENSVLVTGKGLSSEWKGNLQLTGTNMNVVPSGTLHLIKGEYAALGKTFKLNEGQIVFIDKPTPSSTLNISGTLELSGTTITAYLRGPISSPTLTFQSNPQMSTTAILAQILFNKDISDISQPEAIQLATTLISLSGGAGPNVLEAIRKNIGVDRLAIASQTANPDEIAVQIGKYLTKGVLITLSQSATSSQVIVEVEFRHGFVFRAETQEEEEGKFSLKWTHSY